MVHGWFMEFFSVFLKFTYKWTPQPILAPLARSFRGRKHHFFPIIAVFQDFQTIQRLQNYLRGCPSISFNIATFLYIDSTIMSMWRPLFLKCMILDQKLQRMLNDSKIAQLNSERPLHQTAVKDDVPVSNAIRYSVMRSILVWIVMKAATLDYLDDPARRNGKIVGQKVNLLGSLPQRLFFIKGLAMKVLTSRDLDEKNFITQTLTFFIVFCPKMKIFVSLSHH